MYRFLRSEMVKENISVATLANRIAISEKTLRNKLNGETDFTWSEALAIRKIINPKLKLECLFKKEQIVD